MTYYFTYKSLIRVFLYTFGQLLSFYVYQKEQFSALYEALTNVVLLENIF